jgi:hypothetical protein
MGHDMKVNFELTPTRAGDAWRTRPAPTARRAFLCRCGRPVFFGNSQCLACGTPLGYEPEHVELHALEPADIEGTWRVAGASGPQSRLYRRCANFESPAACDWLVAADATGYAEQSLCRACRLNRTIPDLSFEENRTWWGRIELAKRRLVSSLIALGLPVRSRVSEDLEAGLEFDLLRAPPGGPPVTTGHADGIITIDIEEADDAKRERARADLSEPYRTILGHLRHEVGHYYWQRLVEGKRWHEPFRLLFGDERADYAEAIARHHREGPDPQWPLNHVSAYASSHPWEDWAETWAHYLHMVDTLDTALSYGIDAEQVAIHYEPFGPDALYDSKAQDAATFLAFVNGWMELTGVLNEMSRSMGQPDFYPFVLSVRAVRKLHFVHRWRPRSARGAGQATTGNGLICRAIRPADRPVGLASQRRRPAPWPRPASAGGQHMGLAQPASTARDARPVHAARRECRCGPLTASAAASSVAREPARDSPAEAGPALPAAARPEQGAAPAAQGSDRARARGPGRVPSAVRADRCARAAGG